MDIPQDGGFFLLPRKSPVWDLQNPFDFKVALTCIKKASHKDLDTSHIQLKRGTFKTSTRKLAQECGVQRECLRRILTRLERTHICTQECTHAGMLITICDYDIYCNSDKALAPTFAPTNAPTVALQKSHAGSPQEPHYKNNKEELKKEAVNTFLTEKDFDKNEASGLSYLFPFREKKDACIEHLKMRGFVESAISRILEYIYPIEYTGRKAVNV